MFAKDGRDTSRCCRFVRQTRERSFHFVKCYLMTERYLGSPRHAWDTWVHERHGTRFIDLFTDSWYPFRDRFTAQRSIGKAACKLSHKVTRFPIMKHTSHNLAGWKRNCSLRNSLEHDFGGVWYVSHTEERGYRELDKRLSWQWDRILRKGMRE